VSIEPPAGARTGDDEPEDGWDRNDPPHLLLENLRRRLAILRVVDEPRNQLRLLHIIEDLVWLRDRLRED